MPPQKRNLLPVRGVDISTLLPLAVALAPEREQVQVPERVLEQAPELVLEQAPELVLGQAPELVLGQHRKLQLNLESITIPAYLTIFSSSLIYLLIKY